MYERGIIYRTRPHADNNQTKHDKVAKNTADGAHYFVHQPTGPPIINAPPDPNAIKLRHVALFFVILIAPFLILTWGFGFTDNQATEALGFLVAGAALGTAFGEPLRRRPGYYTPLRDCQRQDCPHRA